MINLYNRHVMHYLIWQRYAFEPDQDAKARREIEIWDKLSQMTAIEIVEYYRDIDHILQQRLSPSEYKDLCKRLLSILNETDTQ